eukprot:2550473-Rhodomonas_salina.1
MAAAAAAAAAAQAGTRTHLVLVPSRILHPVPLGASLEPHPALLRVHCPPPPHDGARRVEAVLGREGRPVGAGRSGRALKAPQRHTGDRVVVVAWSADAGFEAHLRGPRPRRRVWRACLARVQLGGPQRLAEGVCRARRARRRALKRLEVPGPARPAGFARRCRALLPGQALRAAAAVVETERQSQTRRDRETGTDRATETVTERQRQRPSIHTQTRTHTKTQTHTNKTKKYAPLHLRIEPRVVLVDDGVARRAAGQHVSSAAHFPGPQLEVDDGATGAGGRACRAIQAGGLAWCR